MFIEDLAIHLVGRQAHLIKCSNFTTAIEIILGSAREPEAQTIFDDVMMAEVMGQCQAFSEETSAHLSGRLTDFAIEMR